MDAFEKLRTDLEAGKVVVLKVDPDLPANRMQMVGGELTLSRTWTEAEEARLDKLCAILSPNDQEEPRHE